jgi:hypothetical protein
MEKSEKTEKTEKSEDKLRAELNILMRECLDDAKAIVQEKRLLENQTVLSTIAVALFVARRKEK